MTKIEKITQKIINGAVDAALAQTKDLDKQLRIISLKICGHTEVQPFVFNWIRENGLVDYMDVTMKAYTKAYARHGMEVPKQLVDEMLVNQDHVDEEGVQEMMDWAEAHA